jgi:hypothetical protein
MRIRASRRPQMWKMKSSGSSRWKKVRAEEGEGTKVNEDQNFWKTTDVKDEDFWFLEVEEWGSEPVKHVLPNFLGPYPDQWICR